MIRLVTLLILFLSCLSGFGQTILPEFTPNVVDSAQTLSKNDRDEINQALKKIRESSNIWGAVYIVQELLDESIEELSLRAFEKWKLGQKGVDNGLLLVLALDNRKSRIEVGYGLEGDLPDIICKKALDEALRPLMRQGKTKDAIILTFEYLEKVKLGESFASPSIQDEISLIENHSEDDFPWSSQLALAGFSVYTLLLWLTAPLTNKRRIFLMTLLERSYPEYKISRDPDAESSNFFKLGKSRGWKLYFWNFFFTINPGIFIFFLAGVNQFVMMGFIVSAFLAAWCYYYFKTNRYRSKENYLRYIEKLRRRNQDMINKGHMIEVYPGRYKYTQSYYESDDYKISQSRDSFSSSSDSGSSSSSSSEGGRSGGGGASSDW